MASVLDLRIAETRDAPMLSTLMAETFLSAYGHVAPADSLQRHIANNYDATRIGERIAAGEIEIWIVESRDACGNVPREAGYLQLGLQVSVPAQLGDRAALEVQRCYMRPDYIGSSGAHQLMAQAQQRARELGTPALHLSVYQLAPRAVSFYRKHGFREVAAIKYYIDQVEFDDWLMLWQG